MAGRRFVSTKEAARALGVHPNTIRNKIKSGEIPAREVLRGNKKTYVVPESYLTGRARTPRSEGPRRERNTQLVGEDVAKNVAERIEALLEENWERLAGARQGEKELLTALKQLAQERARADALAEQVEILTRQIRLLTSEGF